MKLEHRNANLEIIRAWASDMPAQTTPVEVRLVRVYRDIIRDALSFKPIEPSSERVRALARQESGAVQEELLALASKLYDM